ncbi:ankyrin repeat domain-containing protein, partial [Rickettsiales bacterium]|nr:ankyrin repeat domain-containing protein [Rickettsiales bacterium]
AAYYGKIDVVIELIAAGAKLEFVDKGKLTPLAIASANDRSNSVKAIIAAGADINIRDNYGRTPLYIAAVNGRTDTVKALITAGADIDIRDNDDRTPLSVANRMGYLLSVANRTGDLHTEIAKLLSEKESHNEAEELKKLMLSFFFAFVIVSCFYNEDRRKERNNVLRREYIEQLENSPVGKLSDQQFSRILNDDMKTLICTISHECLSATNVLAVDGNPNSLYSVDGLSQWLNPKAEANNGTKFHRIDAEGKFRDIYTYNICNVINVKDVTEAISKAFIKRKERVSPIIQSLARGYITRKELRENDLDGSITPIEADDDPANAVGYAAKELERRKAGGGVEAQLE